jgi:DNA helicase HerA-like ATPase
MFSASLIRGARKFGLGTVMVTQTITGIDSNVSQNIPLMIILGGSDAYVNEVAKALNLTNEDVKWLTTALPPHMAGLTTKAIVITGPIKRQATIELEPAVKGLG